MSFAPHHSGPGPHPSNSSPANLSGPSPTGVTTKDTATGDWSHNPILVENSPPITEASWCPHEHSWHPISSWSIGLCAPPPGDHRWRGRNWTSRSPSHAFPQPTLLKARLFSGQFHQNHTIDLFIIRKNKIANYPRTPWMKVDQYYFPVTPQLSHNLTAPLTPSPQLVPHRGACGPHFQSQHISCSAWCTQFNTLGERGSLFFILKLNSLLKQNSSSSARNDSMKTLGLSLHHHCFYPLEFPMLMIFLSVFYNYYLLRSESKWNWHYFQSQVLCGQSMIYSLLLDLNMVKSHTSKGGTPKWLSS